MMYRWTTGRWRIFLVRESQPTRFVELIITILEHVLTFPISRPMMLNLDRPSCHRCRVHFNLWTKKDLDLCRPWRRSATNWRSCCGTIFSARNLAPPSWTMTRKRRRMTHICCLTRPRWFFHPIFIDMSLDKDLSSPSPRRQPLARNGPHQHLPNGIYLLKKEGSTFPSFP